METIDFSVIGLDDNQVFRNEGTVYDLWERPLPPPSTFIVGTLQFSNQGT